MSLPHAHLDQVSKRMGGSARTLSAALGYAGVLGAQAKTLMNAFTAKRSLKGLITVRAYDQAVRRTRSLPFNMQFFATDAGCYLAQRKPGRDGQEWYTLAPADSRKLIGTINEMIRLLTRPAARV